MHPQHATAYLFPDRLVLHSLLDTDYGSFACGPFQRLERDAAAEDVARAVRLALESSRRQSDMPAGREWQKAFFAGVGVMSNAQLQRTALLVSISQQDDSLDFLPSHNGGTAGDQKGFQPIAGVPPIRIPATSPPADIAAVLMRAFSLCTSIYA